MTTKWIGARPWTLTALLGLVSTSGGCAPGYMTASELDSRKQGPGSCENSCHELGMRMAALVLVSDAVPACVCAPLQASTPSLAPPLSPPPPGPAPAAANEAGSAATGGYVVIAAAAEAARQQAQRQRQQQTYSQK